MPRKKDKKPIKIVGGVKYEGFFALPEPSAELRAEIATERHLRWFRETNNGFDLLLTSISHGKQRDILSLLHGNANATMNQLRDQFESEPLQPDALRKMIDRMNNEFADAGLPLAIEKERGGSGFERVWLNIIN